MRPRSIARRVLAVAVLASLVAFPAIASAESTECKEPPSTSKIPSADQRYCFGSDPLSAGTEGPNGVLIPVRRHPPRITLIRPRTHFVPELVRSAEAL